MTTAAAATPSSSSGEMHCLAHRLRRGGVWIIGGRSLGMAVVLANHIFLARILPTGDFAAFVLASTIVVCFSMAAMFGLNTLVCRYLAESLGVGDSARARSAIRLAACIGTVSIGGLGVAGWLCATFVGDVLFQMPQLSRCAGLVALWIVLLAISQILAEIFRGIHDLRMAGLLAGVTGGLAWSIVFFVALAVTSVFTPLDFGCVVLIAAMSLLLPIALAAVSLPRVWSRAEKPAATTPNSLVPLTTMTVVREAWPMMLVQVLSFAVAQLDIWIVGFCCSDADLAVYAVARRLSLLVAIPLTQVSLVVASSISELNAQEDRQQRLEAVLRGAATVAFLGACVVAIALIALPAVVLGITFGPMYAAGAQPLRLLCLGQIIFALTGPCGPALIMTGHQRIPLWALLISAPLFLLAPYAATAFGPEAVAMISASAITVQNVFQWLAVRILLGRWTHPSISPKYLLSIMVMLYPSLGSARRRLGPRLVRFSHLRVHSSSGSALERSPTKSRQEARTIEGLWRTTTGAFSQ